MDHNTMEYTMQYNRHAGRRKAPKGNPSIQIFNDLAKYKEFCVEYGYPYDEAHLYNNRSYIWRQYTKLLAGKEVRDQWATYARR